MSDRHPSRDDLAAYSLGALDPPEAEAVSAHAPGCKRCTRELSALAPAVAVLGESVEQLEPPAKVRKRVLSVVQKEARRRDVSRDERAPVRERLGLGGMLLRPAVGLAAIAIAAAGVAGYLVAKGDEGGPPQTTVALSRGEHGMAGTMKVGDSSATMELQGMRQLTGGDVYQVWVGHRGVVERSSTFRPDSNGDATVAIHQHMGPGSQLMVTREPHPGEPKPTPPVLLSTSIQ